MRRWGGHLLEARLKLFSATQTRYHYLAGRSRPHPGHRSWSRLAGPQRERLYSRAISTYPRSSADSVQNILDDASLYRIYDQTRLNFEFYVSTHHPGIRTRLLDQPGYEYDFGLWNLALRYQSLLHGDDGIKSVWNRVSLSKIRRIPAAWVLEERLWPAFVDLAVRDESFSRRLVAYAKELWKVRSLQRSSLFAEMVGGFLQSENAELAPETACRLKLMRQGTSEELMALFNRAVLSLDRDALGHFRTICDTFPQHGIYREVISTLCEADRVNEAVVMHGYLLGRLDGPTVFKDVEPLVRKIYGQQTEINLLIKKMDNASIYFGNSVRQLSADLRKSSTGLTGEDLRQVLSQTFGVQRRRVSDGFAARFFATRSFSFEMAFQAVKFLGLESLGPISLRELALQAESAAAFRERIRMLSDAGLDTGASPYSRVIRKLLQKGQDSLLMHVVHCDLHPDDFGNLPLQNELLDTYLGAEDWQQVNRTIAILETLQISKGHPQNFVLRCAIAAHAWSSVEAMTSQMNQPSYSPTDENLKHLEKETAQLGQTSGGRLNASQGLLFLAGICQRHVRAGQNAPAEVWHAIFIRLGEMRMWDDVARLSLWLCHHYNPQAQPGSFLEAERSAFVPDRRDTLSSPLILKEIFIPVVQRAIIGLDFATPRSYGRLAPKATEAGARWACGVELLCHMRDKFGVFLNKPTIGTASMAMIERMLSSAELAQRERPCKEFDRLNLSPQACVALINKIYGKKLLDPLHVRLWSRAPHWPEKWKPDPIAVRGWSRNNLGRA